MKIDAFAARLHGVNKKGNKFMALCPAHEDHNPSLSVAKGKDGRILVKCLAGCETESVVAAMRLRMSDLFNDFPRKRASR